MKKYLFLTMVVLGFIHEAHGHIFPCTAKYRCTINKKGQACYSTYKDGVCGDVCVNPDKFPGPDKYCPES